MDDVFGASNFVATVIWRSSDNSNNDAKQLSTDHNYIIAYSKDPDWRAVRLDAVSDQVSHFANPDGDSNGRWFDGNPLNSPKPRDNLKYEITSPTGYKIPWPANGWRWSPETLEARIATGEIRFTPDGRGIRRRTYLKDHKGLPASSLWTDLDETGHNRQAKSELKRLFPGVSTSQLFSTPKPEWLLHKIMTLATTEGDIVLDPFAGSGTTPAVAHKMKRRWVVVEREGTTITKFTTPRLSKVVVGSDPGGITVLQKPTGDNLPDGLKSGEAKAASKVLGTLAQAGALDGIGREVVEALSKTLSNIDKTTKHTVWLGGGGFRVLEVAPSMFEADEGLVFLAEGMTNGKLAEVTAAQLGFDYKPEPPFAGRKGRRRLAVVDGVVNGAVVELLA